MGAVEGFEIGLCILHIKTAQGIKAVTIDDDMLVS